MYGKRFIGSIASFFPKKAEVIRISLSIPFLVKNRCKGCGEHPSIYYFIRNPSLWNDPREGFNKIDKFKMFLKRMCMDFYLMDDPSSFDSISLFNHKISYNSYNPKLHKSIGINRSFDMIEYLTCECGQSVWAFYDKSSQNRIEIKNRKSNIRFPNKFAI